jgi:hypothetical protein
MTETEWLECEQPGRLLEFVHERTSPRKWRLLACALCRRVGSLLQDKRSRRAVETAEGFADGLVLASPQALAEACQGAVDAWSWWPRMDKHTWQALGAATSVAKPAIEISEMVHVLENSLGADCRLAPAEARRDRCEVIRDIFGNPFHSPNLDRSWYEAEGASLPPLVRSIYSERRFEAVPEVADLLEKTGCRNGDIIAHCKQPSEHVRGCWVLDLLLDQS